MSEKRICHDDVRRNNGNAIIQNQNELKQKGCKIPSYLIEVCQGPDCTGLGGGIAILEIEELVREDSSQKDVENIRVVVGGCRDFCSVGPNVHIHQRGGKKKRMLLESFSNVRDASSCARVVARAIEYDSSEISMENSNEIKPDLDLHRSMMARRAARMRWEALKDVSRTITKIKKMVAASSSNEKMEGKLRNWKEQCKDRIERIVAAGNNPREKRRIDRLVEIASERLDRICLQMDDMSDSSSYSSSDDSSNN